MNTVAKGWNFVRGLRRTLRLSVTPEQAEAKVRDHWQNRDERFVTLLDLTVWPFPASPHRALFAHAGYEPDDVRALVKAEGLDATLAQLVRDGVYVAYEEYRGLVPARRGSASFDFTPASFGNPTTRPDMVVTSGGTRSGGLESGASFSDMHNTAAGKLFERMLFGVHDAPAAVWQPAFPGFAGLHNNMSMAIAGNPAEHWWSQTEPVGRNVRPSKRAVNALLPLLCLGTGSKIPRPEFLQTSDPDPVLDWCRDALDRRGRAVIYGYASSLAAVGTRAVERGVRLDGLVMRMGNEPMTEARRRIIEQAGVTPMNSYNFTGPGSGGIACPACEGDELHVSGWRVGLTTRRRTRPDGVDVDALLFTGLSPTSGHLWINVENDDYGVVSYDDTACSCRIGAMGVRQRIRGIRGISKVVAGGVIVKGEVFEHLVDQVLPTRFGGGPVDYQFSELEEDGQPLLLLRAAPRLGALDDATVRQAIVDELRATELGRMALDVWSPTDALRIARVNPVPAKSGKLLAFEPLRP